MGRDTSLGVGLNRDNIVTSITEGAPAARAGIQLGDIVLGWQGQALEGNRLQDVFRPAPVHILSIARGNVLGSTPRPAANAASNAAAGATADPAADPRNAVPAAPRRPAVPRLSEGSDSSPAAPVIPAARASPALATSRCVPSRACANAMRPMSVEQVRASVPEARGRAIAQPKGAAAREAAASPTATSHDRRVHSTEGRGMRADGRRQGGGGDGGRTDGHAATPAWAADWAVDDGWTSDDDETETKAPPREATPGGAEWSEGDDDGPLEMGLHSSWSSHAERRVPHRPHWRSFALIPHPSSRIAHRSSRIPHPAPRIPHPPPSPLSPQPSALSPQPHPRTSPLSHGPGSLRERPLERPLSAKALQALAAQTANGSALEARHLQHTYIHACMCVHASCMCVHASCVHTCMHMRAYMHAHTSTGGGASAGGAGRAWQRGGGEHRARGSAGGQGMGDRGGGE